MWYTFRTIEWYLASVGVSECNSFLAVQLNDSFVCVCGMIEWILTVQALKIFFFLKYDGNDTYSTGEWIPFVVHLDWKI